MQMETDKSGKSKFFSWPTMLAAATVTVVVGVVIAVALKGKV